MHIDAKMIRRNALAVEWINAENFAEKMSRSHAVELILAQMLFPGQ